MSKTWQNIKFFLGIIIFGWLFFFLCYQGYLYAAKYIHEEESGTKRDIIADPTPAEQALLERMNQVSEQNQRDVERAREEIGRIKETLLARPDTEEEETPAAPEDPGMDPIVPDPVLNDDGEALPDIPEPPADPEPEPPVEPAPPVVQVPADLPSAMKHFNVRKGDPVFIRIIKEKRLLELWMQPSGQQEYVIVKKYPILGMSGTLGPKTKKGDLQAPEGFYQTSASALNPNSSYHLSFNVGYPNSWDRTQSRTGSHIMVHGSDVSVGCFAMGDPGVEEIYRTVEAYVKSKPGKKTVPIQIYPFEPSPWRMVMENKSKHYPFWCFLCDAWNWTEKNRAPAPVVVRKRDLCLEDSELRVDRSGKHTYINGRIASRQKEEAEPTAGKS